MTAPILPVTGGEPPAEAVAALRAGQVVGVPTDTVYGLAVDPWRPGATARLFAVKQRPHDVALPVLVAGVDQARRLLHTLPERAEALMAAFWPGALTIVVPAPPDLGADLGGDGRTVGVRCPDHALIRALAAATGPLAVTSANRHGGAPFPSASAMADGLDGVALVLDGGACAGEPSTVVAVEGGEVRLLRPGAVWPRVQDLE
ncbi:MAG TPA: L-threonylcarbamoyladenylate synthase [Acidimicrobiales bacterium]|nr:L-threonylcarbamoyladenylate synthase [Acidimicrobiales bacterium]